MRVFQGILEIFSGLGMVLGPSIGGALYGVSDLYIPLSKVAHMKYHPNLTMFCALVAVSRWWCGSCSVEMHRSGLLKCINLKIIYLLKLHG